MIPMAYDYGNKYAKHAYSMISATTFDEFLLTFINNIKPSNLDTDTSYCGSVRWTGHSTYSFFCVKAADGGATLFTMYAYASIYVGYIDSANSKQVWEYTGKLHNL